MTTDKTEDARGGPDDLIAVLEALKAAKGTRNEEVFKIEAIRVCARLGMAIPEELLPLLDDACDAWIKAQGNALRTVTTRIKKWLLVTEVCGLMAEGYTKGTAIKKVCGLMDTRDKKEDVIEEICGPEDGWHTKKAVIRKICSLMKDGDTKKDEIEEICRLMDNGYTKKAVIGKICRLMEDEDMERDEIYTGFGLKEDTARDYYKEHKDTRKYMEGLTKKRRL